MNNETFHTIGDPLPEGEQHDAQMLEIIRAANKHPFITFLEVRCRDTQQIAVLEFQVELPQIPPVDIRRREIIAVEFPRNDNAAPMVFALRKNFPDTLHQGLVERNSPKSLCVFDEPYQEMQSRLTLLMLLERIANWLKRAAVGDLHEDDQPIEPLLISREQIIFDETDFDDSTENSVFFVERIQGEPLLLRAHLVPKSEPLPKTNPEHNYVLLPITAPPWHSRIIHYRPLTVADLSSLLKDLDFDLEESIRKFISKLHDNPDWKTLSKFKLIIILKLPKTRTVGGDIESLEWWAFLVFAPIIKLGKRFGLFDTIDGEVGVLLESTPSVDLSSIMLMPLKPIFKLSRTFAQLLSGISVEADPAIVAVGAGALGSQVILNLARQGIGHWSIVDDDRLLPHNSSRHALSSLYEGWNKAEAITNEARILLNDNDVAQAYPVNFLTQEAEIESQLLASTAESDLILDFSTSHAVSRYIAHLDGKSNRMVAFLSPNGKYLVILSTGLQDDIRLDDLEIELAAAIVNDDELHDLYLDTTGTISYAGSCRDMSIQMPQDQVALFAAVAAQYIKKRVFAADPEINIWKWSEQTLSLQRFELPIEVVYVTKIEEWTIRTSEKVIQDMQRSRTHALPNETGGVLIGRIDMLYQIIYIGMILQSPMDSVEQPDKYVRGSENLRTDLEKIKAITGNDLQYVGEWHSHPQGTSNKPSLHDISSHQHIVREMGSEGLPGLIAIQGDDALPSFLLDMDN